MLIGMREPPVLRLLPFFAVSSSGHCSSSSIDQMSSAQLRACRVLRFDSSCFIVCVHAKVGAMVEY